MTPDWHADEDELLSEFNDPNTPWGRKVHILFTLAYKANQKGELGQELTYLESALEIAKTHTLISEQVQLRTTLARVMLNTQGNPKLALEYAVEAEGMLPDFTIDPVELEQKSAVTQIKGKILMAFDRYSEAVFVYKTHVEINLLLQNDRLTAIGYEKLAICYVELAEYDEAMICIEKARDLYLEYAMPADVCDVDRIEARIMLAKNQPKAARDMLISVRDAERVLNDGSRSETKLWLGIAFIGTQEFERAERYLQRVRKGAYKPWQREFKIAFLASEALAKLLTQLGRDAEAKSIMAQARAVDSRLPKANPDNRPFKEVDILLEHNQFDAALIAAGELEIQKCEEGDIAGRWLANFAKVRCYRAKEDSMAIVSLWDSLTHASLEFQDEIVVQMKNMVSHALYKVGRFDEALEINDQLLADYRLSQSIQEKAYAHENRFRFLKAQKKSLAAKKWMDSAIEKNLEAGNIDRALKLSKTFRTGGKESPKSEK